MAPSLKLIELMIPRAQKQALVGGCHVIILTLYVLGLCVDITFCFIKKNQNM